MQTAQQMDHNKIIFGLSLAEIKPTFQIATFGYDQVY